MQQLVQQLVQQRSLTLQHASATTQHTTYLVHFFNLNILIREGRNLHRFNHIKSRLGWVGLDQSSLSPPEVLGVVNMGESVQIT